MSTPRTRPSGEWGDGFRAWLRTLPDQIAACEAEGVPVVVEFPPGRLGLEQQRLMATLGVLVRFRAEP